MLALERCFFRAIICSLLATSVACGDEPEVIGDPGPVAVPDAGPAQAADAGGPIVIPTLTDAGTSVVVTTSGDGGMGGCGSVKAKSEQVKPAVDVVWILDGSGSMLPHALAVADNMLRFMDGVRMSGADINVVMLTGLAFGPILQSFITDMNYHWVFAEVQSTDAYRNTLDAYDMYKQFLRPGAPTHFVVVTDDRSDMPTSEFLPMMSAKHGRPFFFHAVAADGGLLSGGMCPGSGEGTEYFAAAEMTKGDKISLCADWAMNFQKLQGSVIASAPLPCSYAIPPAPNGQMLDPKAVQLLFSASAAAAKEFPKAMVATQCGAHEGWYFDDNAAPKNVMLCPKACDAVKVGGGIEIGFGCAPTIVLE